MNLWTSIVVSCTGEWSNLHLSIRIRWLQLISPCKSTNCGQACEIDLIALVKPPTSIVIIRVSTNISASIIVSVSSGKFHSVMMAEEVFTRLLWLSNMKRVLCVRTIDTESVVRQNQSSSISSLEVNPNLHWLSLCQTMHVL